MQEVIVQLAQQHPVIISVLAAMGLARTVFKTLRIAFAAYAKETPEKWDDELSAKVEQSKVTKVIDTGLDLFLSIKRK